MDYCKIGKIQAIALVLIVMLNHLILNLPKNEFLLTGNSILLNTIFIILIMFAFIFILLKLFKHFEGKDILDISHFLGGRKLEILVATLFLIFFVFIAGTLLRNFSEGIKIVYFQQVPIFVLLGLLLSIGLISNHFGVSSVIKYNTVIVALMLVNIFLVLISSVGSFVPEKIFPLLGNGINETFIEGITNIYAFSGFCFLYFMMPMLKDNKSFKKISIISIIISSLYLFLAMLTLLFSFSSVISIYELSPIYLILRATEFGRFFQRPDAIFILGWILSIMSFISVIIMFCSIIFRKTAKVKDHKVISCLFTGLIFFVALLPENLEQIRLLQNVCYRYFVLILAFVLAPLILVFANIKYKRLHKNEIREVIKNEKTL